MTQHPRRMVLVHAHPDDESINNGATMAAYAAQGVQVTLVTCTRGEQGEVIPAELAHLGTGDRLGDHRVGELSAAMAALGVHDHRFLGDPSTPGRTVDQVRAAGGAVFADSGMAYDRDGSVIPLPDPPVGAFALTDLDGGSGPAEQLAAVLREIRPQVVVGYEPGGGYGHPDHVQAHRVMMRAVDLAAEPGRDGAPGWGVPKLYWTVTPASVAAADLRDLRDRLGDSYVGPENGAPVPSMVVPDEQVTTVIDAGAAAGAKADALRAHATQVVVGTDGSWFALSNDITQPLGGTEYYRLVRGRPAGPTDQRGRETDLFAGITAM